MFRFAVLFLAAVFVPGHVSADTQEAIANRFVLEKTENGFVRMDTGTGELSICSNKAGQLVCRLPADERRAFEEALSDLSDRVSALEQRLAAVPPGGEDSGLPDDAELDRALGAMEKMMRGFFSMMEDLRRDLDRKPADPDQSVDPLPDRT